MTLTRPPDWTTRAACVGLATRTRDPWAPGDHLTPEEQGFELHLARRICASCPVLMECLTDELGRLTEAEPVAMRGALTPEELVDLARSLRIPHRRGPAHGKRSTYVAGCRCDRCRNAHRVYEHERRLRAPRRRPTAAVVHAWLTKPHGRGKHRAEPGQLLLFTDGLPTRLYAVPEQLEVPA